MKNSWLMSLLFLGTASTLFIFQNCSSPQAVDGQTGSSIDDLLPDQIFIQIAQNHDVDYFGRLTIEVLNPQPHFSYQWYHDGRPLPADYGSAQLVFENALPEQSGQYYVSVNNRRASNTVTAFVKYPSSCKEIKQANPNNMLDDVYEISPSQNRSLVFEVDCVMSYRGGGWTRISYQQARDLYGGRLIQDTEAVVANEDPQHGPFTQDQEEGHSARYSFNTPFEFQEFTLINYQIRANSGRQQDTSEIYHNSFVQTTWGQAFSGFHGDVSFGSMDRSGPTTSFAAINQVVQSHSSIHDFESEDIFNIGLPTRNFTISWGENGPEWEGWYPWYSGYIYLR
jgi:hypothetical protein